MIFGSFYTDDTSTVDLTYLYDLVCNILIYSFGNLLYLGKQSWERQTNRRGQEIFERSPLPDPKVQQRNKAKLSLPSIL